MSLDLGPILTLVTEFAGAAIATSGTTVTVQRPSPTVAAGTTNPDTLAVTIPAPTAVAAGIPAIVQPANRQAPTPGLPALPAPEAGHYRVLLLPTVTDVQVGDVVHVDTSRDTRLVGQEFDVVDSPDGFAGAIRDLTCVPRRAPARTV